MKGKKLFMIGMAAAMMLSVAIPSGAAQTTQINGTFDESTVSVLLNTQSSAKINPYGLPANVVVGKYADGTAKTEKLTTAGQIVTDPQLMVNLSDVRLSVDVTVKGTPKAVKNDKNKNVGMSLSSSKPKATSTSKTAQVYFEARSGKDSGLKAVDYTAAADTKICGVNAVKVVEAFNKWDAKAYSSKNADQVLVTKSNKTKKGIATMEAGTKNATTGVITPADGSYMLYRLAGFTTEAPKNAWDAQDGFTVDVTFNFREAAPESAS